MKKFVSIIFVLMFALSLCPQVKAFTLNGTGMNYAGRTRYVPRNNIYANRYQQRRTNYIYTPQQARYNGYRTGINGLGYNNTYYYNRYRR